MTSPLITILIRTHRPELYKRCIKSVENCGYDNLQVHVADGTGQGGHYRYNLLCNLLKDGVTDGWFMFLDDDDVIIPGALTEVSKHMTSTTPIVCQMLRNGIPKPSMNVILRGHIGMPCMIVHHWYKNVADVTARESGDYEWIKAVTDKVGYKWVPVAVVDAGNRSHGK